jgi:head-tail adaptor
MQAGRLRERVTIEAETADAERPRRVTTGWAPVDDGVGRSHRLNGNEAIRAGIERSVSRSTGSTCASGTT